MEHDDLDELPRDRIVALAKGLIGAVPIAGSLLAEVVGTVVPNERLDRIGDFLTALAERLATVESAVLEAQLRSDGAIDLVEEGVKQAAVAVSRPRRQSLAALIADGITDADLEHVYKKRLLQLFGELSDAELLILRGLQTQLSVSSEEPEYDAEFLRNHAQLLYGPRYDICAPIEQLDVEFQDVVPSETTERGIVVES